MITEVGREIIAKYMLGHTSAYATHIGIGSGASPSTGYRLFFYSYEIASNVATIMVGAHSIPVGSFIRIVHNDSPNLSGKYVVSAITWNSISFEYTGPDTAMADTEGTVFQVVGNIYSDTPALNFETRRLPIVAKGFANEDQTQLVFTAELPTNERIVISEASLWTAAADPNATGSPSRLLFNMDVEENWLAHSVEGISPLDSVMSLSDNLVDIDTDSTGTIFATTTNNAVFQTFNWRLSQGTIPYLELV